MTALVDTSFLLAAAYRRDQYHQQAADALLETSGSRLIAGPVLIELFFMVSARISYKRAYETLEMLESTAFTVLEIQDSDRNRMHQLMRQYADAEIDYADAAQVALAERLDIRTIYTFDRRDFGMIRPQHIDYFEIRP